MEIVACLQWHREQMVAGLASDLRFINNLESCGQQEDLELLEFIHGAANSINDLD